MGELICEVTFCELRCKQVVNVVDGRCLGHIIDIVFDLKCGRILGLVTPGFRRWFWFRPREDIFIPWRCVCKIGDDVILVELKPRGFGPAEALGGGGGGRAYSATYEAEPVRAEGGRSETAPPADTDGGEPGRRNERRYEQYYDVYDVPDKEN